MTNNIVNNTDESFEKTLIQGETEEGQTFRPSDWAERMGGSLSTFEGHRMIYSPLLQPMVKNGQKCLLLDHKLAQINPELYQAIMAFAKSNKLKMREEKK